MHIISGVLIMNMGISGVGEQVLWVRRLPANDSHASIEIESVPTSGTVQYRKCICHLLEFSAVLTVVMILQLNITTMRFPEKQRISLSMGPSYEVTSH